MKRLSLLAGLLAATICSYAKTNYALTPLPRYGSGSEEIDKVCFFTNVSPLLAIMPQKVGNLSVTGKGFGLQIDFGAKIPVKIGRGYGGGANTFLSVSAAYQMYNIKNKYNDATGKEHDESASFSNISVPVLLTGIHGHGKVCFYWEGGFSINYSGGVTVGDQAFVKEFKPLSVTPTVGFGIAGDREIKRGWFSGRTSKDMVGPFVAYNVANMASGSKATANCLVIGIRLMAVIM